MYLAVHLRVLAVPLMHFDVAMENVMLISIRQRDKNTVAMQQTDIAWIIIEMSPLVQASHTVLTMFISDTYKYSWVP
jgi:hypothetical protein